MSFGFRSGSTPVKTDSRWVRWAKILVHYQGLSGADSRNNLRQNDPLRMLKVKVLRSLVGSNAFVLPPILINLIPSGTVYDLNGNFILTGLVAGASYTFVFGANDANFVIPPQHNTSGSGSSVIFTTAVTAISMNSTGQTAGLAVTASVYAN